MRINTQIFWVVVILLTPTIGRPDSGRDELSFLAGAGNSNATLDLNPAGGVDRIGNGGFAVGGQYFHQLKRLPALGIGFDLVSTDLGQNESFTLLDDFDSITSLRATQGLFMGRLIWPSGKFHPFIIAGGGFQATSLKLEAQPQPGFVWADTHTTESRTLYDSGKGSWAVAWGIGFDWQVNDIVRLGVEGRLVKSGHSTFSPTPQGQALGLGDVRGSVDTRMILGRASASF